MWLRLRNVEGKQTNNLSFPPPWEFQTPVFLETPGLINLPRKWLSQYFVDYEVSLTSVLPYFSKVYLWSFLLQLLLWILLGNLGVPTISAFLLSFLDTPCIPRGWGRGENRGWHLCNILMRLLYSFSWVLPIGGKSRKVRDRNKDIISLASSCQASFGMVLFIPQKPQILSDSIYGSGHCILLLPLQEELRWVGGDGFLLLGFTIPVHSLVSLLTMPTFFFP